MYEKISILKPFFEAPRRRTHIREFARELKINHMTARKYLEILKKEGFIRKIESKQVKDYQANSNNELFKEYKRFYNFLNLFNSGLINYLDKEFLFPTIVVFGSYARGEDIEGSDIDLFILSETKKEIVLEKFEKKLKRRIQLHLFNKKEYTKLKEANPHLVNNLANGRVLRGQFWVLD